MLETSLYGYAWKPRASTSKSSSRCSTATPAPIVTAAIKQSISRRTVSSSRRQREWGDSRLDAATPVGDGEPVSAEAIAIAGVGVAPLAVLVPLILTLHGRVVAELGELRRDLHAIAERVARIEGALTGPWRPTNGAPAPASKTPPEATAE